MTGRRNPRDVGEQPPRTPFEIANATTIEELMPDPDRRDVALRGLGAVVEHTPEPRPSTSERALRYLDVLDVMSHGLTWEEAAAKLYMSGHTVKQHLKNARQDLAAKNTTHAVAEALRRGLIQ